MNSLPRPAWVRLGVGWALLCVGAFLLGPPLVRGLAPVFKAELEAARGDLRVLDVRVDGNALVADVKPARSQQVLHARSTAAFGLTYPVLVLSLLLAWPFASRRRLAVALGAAAVLLTALVLIDLPAILLLSIEEATRGQEPFLSYLYFNGGRQFMALMVFALALGASHRWGAEPAVSAQKQKRPRAARPAHGSAGG